MVDSGDGGDPTIICLFADFHNPLCILMQGFHSSFGLDEGAGMLSVDSAVLEVNFQWSMVKS